jgi:hypothetical protein
MVKLKTTEKRDPQFGPLLMFALLVAIGVVGRLVQPQWNFTPTAAVTGFAAFWFGSSLIAALVPITVLALSNLVLPDYDSPVTALVVYASFVVPLLLGRTLRNRSWQSPRTWALFAAICTLPAVTFFATTNFAHWALFQQYPHTPDGLIACYTAALPFFRDGTLAGDLCYTALLFGSYAWAVHRSTAAELS